MNTINITNLQTLIDAGSLQEATALVTSWRQSCVELQTTIAQKVADVRRDINSVNWQVEMNDLLAAVRNNNSNTIATLNRSVEQRFDDIDERELRHLPITSPERQEYYQLHDLSKALNNAYLAHLELFGSTIGVHSVWLDEHARQVLSCI